MGEISTDPRVSITECPFSRADTTCTSGASTFKAAAFDPFDADYQLDPAEALGWAREQRPVFYSEKFGYWIVTRYEHVKAIFRDNLRFSPSNVLEPVKPPTPEMADILRRYDYAMNRTLVNEDEPVHMDRRRVLQQTFAPENLAYFEPMVRRLAKEYMDRFIDNGEADLVDQMFWEIPLTVALHFLGVPEEDMAILRKYSIAHTVNIWGRPTHEKQLQVAEAIGGFWQFAGQILERMRRDPSGPGWMHHAIRQQQACPGVISDNFLHSNMMAGIVAAHETTANATANAFRILLQNRAAWTDICADPLLIPNAVEECLRFAGSVVAWRRRAVIDTEIGGVAIPAGAKLLIVMATANRDARQFDHPDDFDIYRSNPSDHLTFGYGSHQCLGKNLARMQMRIYLEEFSRRLPHMELVPEQEFEYLPSISFRGPDHLRVRWDPRRNPERRDTEILNRVTSFGVGAPSKQGISRTVRVSEVSEEAMGVVRLSLEDPQGRPLPKWAPGSHVEVQVGEYSRSYSLCGEQDEATRYQIAILEEREGRGGSTFIHQTIRPGATITIRGPKNHFALDVAAERYILIAGGIGVTPILTMADSLKALGKHYEVHYCGRARASMAFLDRLRRDHSGHLHVYAAEDGRRLDIVPLVADVGDTQVYACGPERMLSALEQAMEHQPDRLRVEHFSSAAARLAAGNETPFEIELSDSKLNLVVSAEQTLLQALHAAGIDVPSDCEEGLCGSCEIAVIAGEIDHRDKVLSSGERATGRRMMSCCSRAMGKLTLAL